jgi:hypothetical protein
MFLKRIKMPQAKNIYLTKKNKHTLITMFIQCVNGGSNWRKKRLNKVNELKLCTNLYSSQNVLSKPATFTVTYLSAYGVN